MPCPATPEEFLGFCWPEFPPSHFDWTNYFGYGKRTVIAGLAGCEGREPPKEEVRSVDWYVKYGSERTANAFTLWKPKAVQRLKRNILRVQLARRLLEILLQAAVCGNRH